ncbi:TPA: hypothetical protein P0E12_004956 [Vibrio harveyi]|nr:hypothetical protein [Vibrio harveyi]
MSAVSLKARIKDGKLEIFQSGEYVQASDVEFNCLGEADSEGYVVVSSDSSFYETNTQGDLRGIVDDLVSLTADLAKMANLTVSRSPDQVPFAPDLATKFEKLNKKLSEVKLK